ncbi:Fic family protein [Derxia lacustris]|uniref:Fic family protein n=1 Tax=Derxia lacustris TaxID=764842 RepID=UPI000A16CFC4|nr:Fic family protein [Derxia lacustris]
MPHWIWQHPHWPQLRWQPDAIAAPLRAVTLAQGRLLGKAHGSAPGVQAAFTLDAMLQNLIDSSAIEGEQLNRESVRSSLARRLGLDAAVTRKPEARGEGLAQITLDATQNLAAPMTAERLLQWQRWLFAGDDGGLLGLRIRVGDWRGPDTMQVVSGRSDRPTVHFEAPPRAGLEARIDEFLAWFNASRADPALDPLLRAALAHLWFVTLHPFDDGNGRLTRALTDHALAQGEGESIRFYAMSVAILADREGYYRELQAAQRADPEAPLDLTPWLLWFLTTLGAAIADALARIGRVLDKARFWAVHHASDLGAEQVKVLNRLLDGATDDRGGFADGISAAQYGAVARVSKATATRHLAELLAKGCLCKLPGGGRSTRYKVCLPGDAAPLQTPLIPDG